MAKQSQKKLDRLLEKAEELFLKNGYKNVSVDQIANETGISKMTVYKHFPSKDDLFIAVIIKYSNYHLEIVEKKLETVEHTIDKIRCLNEYAIEANKDINMDLYKDIFSRPYILEKLLQFKQEASYALWIKILQDGVNKGEIRKIDVEFVARMLMNIPSAFVNSPDIYDGNKLKDLMDKLFDFLRYGLLGGLEGKEY